MKAATYRIGAAIAAMVLVLTVAGCIVDVDLDNDADVFVGEPFSFARDATPYDRIVVRGVNGAVDVVGRPGLGAFLVEGERRVGAGSIRDAERALENLIVDVFRDGDALVIATDQPQHTRGRLYEVDYVITLPSDRAVEIESVNGNVYVADLDSYLFVDHVNGEIDLANLFADVDVRVTNGPIRAEVIVPDRGFVDLGATNGDIQLYVPPSTSAELEARVTNGRISVAGLTLFDVSETPRTLSAMLGNGRGEIDVQTVNGNIRIQGRSFGRAP